jgi:hypothetical protein
MPCEIRRMRATLRVKVKKLPEYTSPEKTRILLYMINTVIVSASSAALRRTSLSLDAVKYQEMLVLFE